MARICTRLDDLPLALQLAAARTSSLGLEAIEGLLAERFTYLEATDESTLDHQRTLGSSIAWSYDALDSRLQRVLADVSVLANDFDLAAACTIAKRGDMVDADVTACLGELVECSLISGPTRHHDRTTYRLLESVRIFARQQLVDSQASDRHLDVCIDRVRAANDLLADEASATIRRIRADWDDIRIARAHAVQTKNFTRLTELLGGLTPFVNLTQGLELLEWCQESLNENPDRVATIDHAQALAGWATLLAQRGQATESQQIAGVARRAYPTDIDVLWASAYGPWTMGDFDETRHWLEVITSGRATGSGVGQAGALLWLAMLGGADGLDISAIVHELAVLATNGDPVYRAASLLAQGIHLSGTDPAKALQCIDECISIGDANDVQLISITARTTKAVQLAFLGTPEQAIESSLDALRWAADRGLWAWSLATMPAAAFSLTRVERFDIATTIVGARSTSEYRSGFGSDLADLLAKQLSDSHPDQYESWWNSGVKLGPIAATRLAVATLSETR